MRHAVLIFAALSATLTAQAPAGYYASVNASTPATLRSTLHAIIKDHTRFPYTASTTDTWDILELADQNPANSSQILDIYKNATYAKAGGGNNNYDREHSWPKSYGFPNEPGSYPHTDCHHLFLCTTAWNNARANKPYDNGNSGWAEWTTLQNGGQGGGSGTFPGNSNWTESGSTLGSWQTWNSRKGDVARALMYLDVRYEGGVHGITGLPEPDLRLTDDLNLIASSVTSNNTTGIAYMGRLSVLLQWHAQDPVDSKEMARNNAVYSFQGNRNPFIDHPEWVACLFSAQCGTPADHDLWINEIHYDNNGNDVNELVEVAGTSGSLEGWSIVAYNGADGRSYAQIGLRGKIVPQQGSYGTRSFAFPGLQNGSPDGIALVAPSGKPVQFLSYEGTFAAVDGPAAGLVSTDIGVSETSTSPVGMSLQLGGTGHSYSAFTWQNVLVSTPGAPNTNQTFQ